LAFQYGIAPYLVDSSISNIVRDGWLKGCGQYKSDDLQKSCVGNNGNYRVAAATFVFFLIAAVAAMCKSTANREAWPAKYVLYCFMVGVTIIIPNEPIFSDIFLNVARSKYYEYNAFEEQRMLFLVNDSSNLPLLYLVGGFVFVIIQQFVIVDMAYNWNDSWVAKSNQADAEEAGSGRKWLLAILMSCVVLYIVSLVGFLYMLKDFTGCGSNNTFLAVTIIMVVLVHVAQLTGEEGSLLASSIVSTWAVYLCYTAVSKNPNEECNSRIGEADHLSIAFGLIVTMLSLGWTGWSYTAADKLMTQPTAEDQEDIYSKATDEENIKNEEKKKVTGLVTGETHGTNNEEKNDADAETPGGDKPQELSNSWRLNVALAALACWASMILTQWGKIAGDGTVANASTGRASMWIIIASQWIALSMYLWTLAAPRLFPDREFS
jgi:serine incorporator 1/3